MDTREKVSVEVISLNPKMHINCQLSVQLMSKSSLVLAHS